MEISHFDQNGPPYTNPVKRPLRLRMSLAGGYFLCTNLQASDVMRTLQQILTKIKYSSSKF